MKTKTKDLIFLSVARASDLITTYLCLRVFSYDLSIEGGIVTGHLINSIGFAGLIVFNILIVILLGLEYGKIEKVRVWLIMRTVGTVSLLFALYNLLVYLSVVTN